MVVAGAPSSRFVTVIQQVEVLLRGWCGLRGGDGCSHRTLPLDSFAGSGPATPSSAHYDSRRALAALAGAQCTCMLVWSSPVNMYMWWLHFVCPTARFDHSERRPLADGMWHAAAAAAALPPTAVASYKTRGAYATGRHRSAQVQLEQQGVCRPMMDGCVHSCLQATV